MIVLLTKDEKISVETAELADVIVQAVETSKGRRYLVLKCPDKFWVGKTLALSVFNNLVYDNLAA